MSGCVKCNGTGFVVACPEPMAGLAGFESEPCECKRDTLPTPERTCAEFGCHGCPACVPGYVP